MVLLIDLLSELIKLSEKAAKVARLVREQGELFKLLVEEKDKDGNKRFAQDFKTLADVLIQQTIKFFLGKKFPKISTIRGEESNRFTGAKGVTVQLELSSDPKELTKLLSQLIGDQPQAVKLLTDVIYGDESSIKSIKFKSPQLLKVNVRDEDIGIWIDPIDGTNEYVGGKWEPVPEASSFATAGLACVTTLIGAYSKESGRAIIGVVNLPFYRQEGSGYTHRFLYGVHYNQINLNNVEQPAKPRKGGRIKVVVSQAESETITDKLFATDKQNDEFERNVELVYVNGLGYKLYLVLTNQADLFFTLKPSTFRWDTCAFSSLFKSMKSRNDPKQSGCLLELKNLLMDVGSSAKDCANYELDYSGEELANKNGLIATLDLKLLDKVLDKLRN